MLSVCSGPGRRAILPQSDIINKVSALLIITIELNAWSNQNRVVLLDSIAQLDQLFRKCIEEVLSCFMHYEGSTYFLKSS